MRTRWIPILSSSALSSALVTMLWAVGYFLVFVVEFGGLGRSRWVEAPVLLAVSAFTAGIPFLLCSLVVGASIQRWLDRGRLLNASSALILGSIPGALLGYFMRRETNLAILVCAAAFAASSLLFVHLLRASDSGEKDHGADL